MPSLAKRSCAEPGCPELVASGRCPTHERSRYALRGTTAERGYDADHKSLRVECFLRDEWRCVDCGWEPDIVREFRLVDLPMPDTRVVLDELRRAFARGDRHLHADHQIPIEVAPDLRLDIDNLKTRCDRCHNRKTVRDNGGFGHRRTA